MKQNYHKVMQEIILENQKKGLIPKLLLHTCCAPCSTTVITRLADFFQITVFYYNPNIEPREEYEKRKSEQIRFLKEFRGKNPISFLDIDWNHEDFLEISKGLEQVREGGVRCHKCYYMRMLKTALTAKEKGYDYFTTSLTISPYKNSQIINKIGRVLEMQEKIAYLYSDFKKEEGYLQSISLSRDYNLYRQNYCGCLYSKDES